MKLNEKKPIKYYHIVPFRFCAIAASYIAFPFIVVPFWVFQYPLALNIVLTVIMVAEFIFSFIFLNRDGYRLVLENGIIKRKGLFFGYKGEVKVDEITQIATTNFIGFGAYYVLKDSSDKKIDYFSSKCYLVVRKDKKGEEFLHKIFDKTTQNDSMMDD